MSKKKILTIAISVALVAILVVGASLAYFTDTKEVTNTFTVGNVEIELLESQYNRYNAGQGNATGKTEPLTGGYIWAANVNLEGTADNTKDFANITNWTEAQGFFSDKQIEDDAATYKAEGGYFETHSIMMPGSNCRKNPYVKNTGASDAYVRVRVLIPQKLFVLIDDGPSYWATQALPGKGGNIVSNAVNAYNTEGLAAFAADPAYQVTRGEGENAITYVQLDFTYQTPLKPGAITFYNCWSNICIDKNADAEDLKNVDSFDVIFEADAIQAEGFADAAAAFTAFDAA